MSTSTETEITNAVRREGMRADTVRMAVRAEIEAEFLRRLGRSYLSAPYCRLAAECREFAKELRE